MSTTSILIVDAQASERTYTRNLLAPVGASFCEAENGQVALDQLQKHSFDLVIAAYQMPVMDGLSFCKKLKEDKANRSIPVVILSDFNSTDFVNNGFDAGANAYISKADAHEQLLPVVKKIIEKVQFKKNKTILIVDDDPHIAAMLSRALNRDGFQTAEAENGLEALEYMLNHEVNLILSDVDMPKMDGLDLCLAVKADPALASIPFVVMSGNAEHAKMMRMMQYGAVSYFTKPFNITEFIIFIDKIFSDHYLLLLKDKELLLKEQEYFLATITSLVSALEAKDIYTRGHSESVASICKGMLALTGAGVAEISRIEVGARLHDIGKIGVKDSVLLKPGKLTAEEYDHIKLHPTVGANILKPLTSLDDILTIVTQHHERWDGKGYPAGLKGEEITFWARITAVADAFDAMTSDRPYRDGMPRSKAQQIIVNESGSQFCPDCVDLFLQWFH